MKNVRYILIIAAIATLFLHLQSHAQDAPVYEQYVFDNTLLNPAFTGLVDAVQIKAAHRQQWFGIDKAPSTSFLLFRARLKERNGGIGGFIYSDKNGANSQAGAQINASFQFLMRSKRKTKTILSFGMGLTLFSHTLDESGFNRTIYDPIVTYGKKSYFGYDANFGTLLTHGGFLIGVSFDNLLQWISPAYQAEYERVGRVLMNAHSGKTFWITNQVQLAPSLIFKSNMKNWHQLDVGIKVKLLSGKAVRTVYVRNENEFIFGLTYKQTLDVGNVNPLSLTPMIGISFNGFSLSYLYDLGLTNLQKYNYGTHQIAVGYRFYRDKYSTWGKSNIASMVYDF